MVIKLNGGISFVVLLLFLSVAEAGVVFAPDIQLSDEEKVEVLAGKLILQVSDVGDEFTKEINAYELIDAPAKDILEVITDYNHLPDFMPNLESVEVLEETSFEALVNYTLALPFGVSKRYRLQVTYDIKPPELRMAWQSVPWPGVKPEETVKSTSGYWLLLPISEKQTLLHYYTKTDPGHVPFGLGWIVDYLTEETVVELLKNAKERVEKQWKEHQN